MNATVQPPLNLWTFQGRTVVFALASTSILCLLADFCRSGLMRTFTFWLLIPALVALGVIAVFDRWRGDRQLWRAVWAGSVAGLGAAVAYDVFRVPFVYARDWGIDSWLPHLSLFKVFPRFGAMILGEPIEQTSYSAAAQLIGWTYHFSNGLTFGVMYLALIGDARRRHWLWAVVMALTLEAGMLLSAYPAVFHIPLSPTFISVTVAAHLVFGVALGLTVRWMAQRRTVAA